MKFFKKRAVAWVVLVLAVVGSVCIGLARKDSYLAKEPTELLDVAYQQWICDDATILDDTTEALIRDYNARWDEKYYAVVAVATIDRLTGWEGEDYAAALGQQWGLGANDMILLLVEEGDWQVYCGDNVYAVMTTTQQSELRQAIESSYYSGDYDSAVTAFFRQADVVYHEMQLGSGDYYSGNSNGWAVPAVPGTAETSVSITGLVLLVVMIFVVWILIDRVRYNHYRRRYVTPGVTPTVAYYPIFWGRRPRSPRRPVPPRAPYGGGTRPPMMGGGYQPPRTGSSRPNTHNTTFRSSRPSGGGNNFGGGRNRGGFSGGGFSGGSRSSGSRGGGSRGGFGGGGFGGGHR